MASSSRIDYEIISDPFNPQCVIAGFIPLWEDNEKEKLLLERIRGKEGDTSLKYTPQEERDLINGQIRNSQGFDVDFSMFRCLFNFYPSSLDESHSTLIRETDRIFFGRLAQESIADYNINEGTSFDFLEVEKANLYRSKGYIYFITFVAKDPCHQTKVFQAKVCNVFCREIEHSFCRLKPGQQVECDEDSKRVVKKPRCVVACFNYSIFGEVTEEDKLLLERIRGKEDNTSPKYTDQEERNLINKQIRKSQGFDVDFYKFRCLFDFYPSFLDECHSTLITETDRQFFGRLAQDSIADYNVREGTSFEFVEVEKANLYRNKGYIYFITFVAKDSCDKTKVFQAKVCNVFCREIEHSFCRLKPCQKGECHENSERAVKRPRYNTRSNKRAGVFTNVS
uniref:Cystatin domain-containing protein n=1 Tax=Brassica campestris TaxID=3711 RepID=M4CRK5_BRACM